jgi:hypothetical protein
VTELCSFSFLCHQYRRGFLQFQKALDAFQEDTPVKVLRKDADCYYEYSMEMFLLKSFSQGGLFNHLPG